ncbi:heart- and neural crest derivatives-expressed protein 2-like [Saccoglossus kowalevskii]|uniref:Heart- and neural crest derivatives-expressed protein 2-like n=2 Tax=Saccoglossus kowalevskii TaxID=10224 RepID=A0ABM0M4N8_SACKO|nr:PREDICTED: heart- and neural crest derivatives-expressed protein 2-like [Saccoglossus kowalevskii]
MSLVSGYSGPHPVALSMSSDCAYHHNGIHSATAQSYHLEDHDGPYYQNWILNGGELSPTDYSMQCSPPNNSYEHDFSMGAGAYLPKVRPVKRRCSANKKERRRTQSINSAFADLRDCIPNVPTDTKLSKIKTLRLATSYISYLMDLLGREDAHNLSPSEFQADIRRLDPKRRHSEPDSRVTSNHNCDKRLRGRTGWPQHVWALELRN